jgi:NiFe hydrogenase small subunit HydA
VRTTNEWLDRLADKATAVIAVGTCATYGGIHAMAGNPTGAMGVPDYLGWDWKSKAGLPIVCVPGCPIHPDNLSETILYLLYQVAGQAPMIPLDSELRPQWLFSATVHEGCDRAGYYEQGEFATEYGSPKCLVKLGCWGPVVNCNVPKRGWVNGIGGCPNVGGAVRMPCRMRHAAQCAASCSPLNDPGRAAPDRTDAVTVHAGSSRRTYATAPGGGVGALAQPPHPVVGRQPG